MKGRTVHGKAIESEFGLLVFHASIPLLQSAITFAGDEGARLKLDIPESDIAAASKLLLMRGKILKVTIEAVRQNHKADDDLVPDWDTSVLMANTEETS